MSEYARLFNCPQCHRQVVLCPRCDRGNHYCSRECSKRARRQSQRLAGRRYQDGLPGRRKHAARQRRYRERQRCRAVQSETCGRKVTHHPSTRQHRRVVVARTPRRRRGTRPFGDEEPPRNFRCSSCGQFCSVYVHPGLRTVRHPAREG